MGPAEAASGQLAITGPAVAGGLAVRGADRSRGVQPGAGAADFAAPQAVGDKVDTGELPAVPARSEESDLDQAPMGSPGSPGMTGEPGASPAPAAGSGGAADIGEQAREDGGPGWARRHWKGLVSTATLLAALLVGLAGFLWWLSSQWYVGVNAGYVAIHQGIAQQVGGVELNRVTSTSGISVTTLPYYDQAQVERTIDAATQAEAQRIVAVLAAKASACASAQAPLGCPPAPTPVPITLTPTPSPTASPSSAPTSALGPVS